MPARERRPKAGTPLIEERSASGADSSKVTRVHVLPKDAIVVMRPHETAISRAIMDWAEPRGSGVTYDFQRDKATNTHFKDYVNAANYAVGVYMAGVGYGKWESVKIAQTYGFLFSSKKYDDNARDWTEKGWNDAHQGDWR